jgi:hypothetical protein
MISLAGLKKAGFEKTGGFSTLKGGPELWRENIPGDPGLYLFVIDEEIYYVGKTQRSLRRRILAYRRALDRDFRRREVHNGLEEALDDGKKVEVYTLIVKAPRHLIIDDLPFDYLVGLEAGLILNLQPDWNSRGTSGRARRTKLYLKI